MNYDEPDSFSNKVHLQATTRVRSLTPGAVRALRGWSLEGQFRWRQASLDLQPSPSVPMNSLWISVFSCDVSYFL